MLRYFFMRRNGNTGTSAAALTRRAPLTLRQRKLLRLAHHAIIGIGVGAALLFLMQTLEGMIPQQNIVVASQTITKGTTLNAQHAQAQRISVTQKLRVDYADAQSVVGTIAQRDIQQGELLTASNTTRTPLIPAGSTVIDVPLASNTQTIAIGQHIRLFSTALCTPEQRICPVAHNALVVGQAHATQHGLNNIAQQGAQLLSQNAQAQEPAGQVLSVAVSTQDAARIMQVKALASIIAVNDE